MFESFDPYHVWLGIPPEEQPPNHYRLLGIAPFESDPEVISMAAFRQMAHIKSFAVSPHSDASQRILGELTRARLCLLSADKKAEYDSLLRALLSGKEGALPANAPAKAVPVEPVPTPKPSGSSSVLRTWIIGSDNQCDLVVDHPAVSRRHCQLTQTDRGFFLEDLDSRNGTYLNGQRITARIAVGHCDAVQLGQHVPMPWPPEVPVSRIRLIRIGAGPDNDIVFDLPMVSWRHAVIRVEQGYAMLEDAGSTNGTGIGDRSNRIAEPTRLKKGDVVFFGSHQVTAEELIDRAREILKRM